MIVISYNFFSYQVLIVPSHFFPFLSLLCFLQEQNSLLSLNQYNFRQIYEVMVYPYAVNTYM